MRKIVWLVIGIGGASFSAALAQDGPDTRNVVLERAAHCNVLPEGRLWLDCYYGAAQPARIVLSLPPAPQSQPYQQFYAQPLPKRARALSEQDDRPDGVRGDVLNYAEHCGVLSAGRLWLDCYYGAAQPMRQALGLSPAPQAEQFQGIYTLAVPHGVTDSKPDEGSSGLLGIFVSPKVPREKFGFRNAKPGPGVNVDRIIARIVDVKATKTGFTVTLDNGQVWKQVDTTPISWHSRGTSYSAIITHGAFNTFNLHLQLGKALEYSVYKVQRIK